MSSRVFRFMVLSFFISNIMTVLGSVIDGFVVGNTMDENTIAAVGFVSPVVILFSIIGATACVGFKTESDEISAVIGDLNDVIEFSDRTLEFCEAKGHSPKLTFYTALSVEEMAKNVVEHGFTKDKKENFLSARVVDKGDELIIRMRDDCPRFDPREKYEQIYANEDLSRVMGIRMIMTEAKEVKYTSMFRLNNLLIRIGTKETKKKDPEKKADEESAE